MFTLYLSIPSSEKMLNALMFKVQQSQKWDELGGFSPRLWFYYRYIYRGTYIIIF